jgi:CubicO group peptidase (beta-lactamase class C family)
MAELAQDWAAIVEALDRHQFRGLGSADRAGLPELMRQYDLPGLGIAVEEAGVGQWAAGFGTTAADAPLPVTPRTVFQACSISKHVAAFGVLRLVDAGVVDLDEDIAAYLTSWRLPACDGWTAVVTIRQLLAHTAGLSYNWFRGFRAGQQLPTMSQVLAGQPPATSPPVRVSMLPGSRFRYSGSHYAVLQQLVEDVTEEPFTRLMRTLVFDPVGMTDSDYDQDFPYGRPDLVAVGHHVDGTPVAGRWRTQPELAGAGLWTTPADLTRLGREITRAVAGRSALLSRQLADQMVTPQVPDGFGLGTQVEGRRFGHTGGNVGYGCWSYTWPAPRCR